ncbi:uncharacterized protein DEA37_0007298 [Paragonimus westermani]|uniref:Uncharacterized protein n=1 Tax=Paragonimus westermani TaxID=34504 RepID=A0A5J4NMV6_9TREM|nr:uncharacterized protein DEA37_0007298 [Paragonimus westermani]
MRPSKFWKANLLAWKPDHENYLLELSHKPSSGHGRADAVVRFSEGTNGQLNVIARWRPTLFEEALFHGTELTDIHHLKKVISMSFQSTVLWGRRVRAILQEKIQETVDLRKLQNFKTCLLKDLQAAPDTITKWRENDVLLIRTLNVPVIEELAKFSFYELEKNVTESLSIYISVVNHMLSKCFSETGWTVEWLNTTKTIILNERLRSMRSTVVELLKLANISLQLKSRTENYLFQQVAGAGSKLKSITKSIDYRKILVLFT